jgi:pimeloyl-ACP methyl ester carboxylesterase
MSARIERHLVPTDVGYMHVRTTGAAGQAQPDILFLHQVPASSRIWLSVMNELGEFSSIAPDNFNLGESDATPRTLTLEEHADYLWTVTQQLRPGPKLIVGHHTGAAIAAVLADKYAEDIVGVIYIGYPYYRNWKERLAKYERLNPAGTQPDGSGAAYAWQFIDRAFLPESDRDLVFDAFADRMRAGRVWYEGYVALWNADLTEIAQTASTRAIPSLLLAPDRDSLSVHAETCAEILGAELREITGGAFVLTEDPALLAEIVRDFYLKVGSR